VLNVYVMTIQKDKELLVVSLLMYHVIQDMVLNRKLGFCVVTVSLLFFKTLNLESL